MYIDAHVHLRDAVFDMPNTDPSITTRELVMERLKLVKEANIPEVFYGIYMGITKDPEQIKQAVETHRELPQVVGMKLYAGHSVGSLGVIKFEDQQTVYETLAKEGYDGLLVVHAEKESLIKHELWNPNDPISHCYARPPISEIESIYDQLKLVNRTQFRGKLHITHISSLSGVDVVDNAKKNGIDISCGICPHHFIYDWEQMKAERGILWKMNPPLRSPESRERILQALKNGKIDWIETDHAPHSLEEKTKDKFLSGIPGLAWWPLFEEYLRQNDFSYDQIEKLTFSNIINRFNLNITKTKRTLKDHRDDYSFNPYQKIEEELRK